MPTPYHPSRVLALGLIALLGAAITSACIAPVGAPVATDTVTSDTGSTDTAAAAEPAPESQRPSSWTEASHSNNVDPNPDVVFPVDAVNTITITIAPDDWAAMQSDLNEIYATALPIREAVLAAGPGLSEDELLEVLREATAEAARTAAAAKTEGTLERENNLATRSPIWVPATISFEGQEWPHVGVRYKGVSSLGSAFVLGEMALPFKFDFDEFEDDFPEIRNQRFFGYKQLSMANNHLDPAGMRDTLVYDLLEEAGLPSLQTAAYEIILDHGDGPLPLGLYTAVEVVDDTGVQAYFGSDDGNLYEGDGRGATLLPDFGDQIEASFEKKNNEDEADWSDIMALYAALNDESRTNDPATWRSGLEALFDVDGFLEWLAISAIVGHTDHMSPNGAHNFYLYNNPETGLLTWISWDHNMTFLSEFVTGVILDRPDLDKTAPLIGFLLNDPIYYARYRELLAEAFASFASPGAVSERVGAYAQVLEPAATRYMSAADYDAAVQEILDFVTNHGATIESFLAEQE